MGKSITQQARGRGGPAYTVRKQAYVYKISYPTLDAKGVGKVIQLLNSTAHTTPLAKIMINNKIFYVPAANGLFEGQEISIDEGKLKEGNILRLKNIPPGTKIFNIEFVPGKGGKIIRTSGGFAITMNKDKDGVEILIKRRKLKLNENCRAIIGVAAGSGRVLKPFVKAGNKHFLMKSKGRKWHFTSAIKTNAVDHPFGSGRGKRIKSKIAQRNAPPGAKVGHLRPRRTGHIK
ncbi:50S ribosomal protein L2 [Candidatus Pacearchaeota archaeon]|nr:50S ribosomal protein L2P [uncultured archaeon]MBS3075523.1 50S ribosomal protein L2 [Candidatus Pacearchaeota archaeon]